jgi:hypothetical protein
LFLCLPTTTTRTASKTKRQLPREVLLCLQYSRPYYNDPVVFFNPPPRTTMLSTGSL